MNWAMWKDKDVLDRLTDFTMTAWNGADSVTMADKFCGLVYAMSRTQSENEEEVKAISAQVIKDFFESPMLLERMPLEKIDRAFKMAFMPLKTFCACELGAAGLRLGSTKTQKVCMALVGIFAAWSAVHKLQVTSHAVFVALLETTDQMFLVVRHGLVKFRNENTPLNEGGANDEKTED